jgi:hypothetical protein
MIATVSNYACSIHSGSEHDESQTIRFQSAKHGQWPSLGACRVPAMAGIVPRPGVKTCAGMFFALNRAVPAGNAPAPHRRINHKRADNHGDWIRNRVASKGSILSLANSLPAVNRAGVTARGFVWLTVSREIPKAPNLVRKKRAIQATVNPTWVCCLQPT